MKLPRWLRWIGFALLVLGLLIALFYAEEDWRGAREWARVKKELQARGESLEYQAILPPPVPDNQNAAAAPIFTEYFAKVAANDLDRQANPSIRNVFGINLSGTVEINDTSLGKLHDVFSQQSYRRPAFFSANSEREFDVVGWQKYFTGKENPATAATDILAALQPYDETIREVREAMARPAVCWPRPVDKPYADRFSYLNLVLDLTRFLQLRALVEIEAGQSDAAIDDLELQLRLASSLNTNFLLISHLVLISVDNISLATVERGLEKHIWDEKQLRRIEDLLAQRNSLEDFRGALKGERAFSIENTRLLSQNPWKVANSQQPQQTLPMKTEVFIFALTPSGWFDLNEALYSEKVETDFLDSISPREEHVDLKRARAVFAEEDIHIKWSSSSHGNFMVISPLYSLRSSLIRTAYSQSLLNAARTACALEDYRLQNGQLPATLDALVPAFLSALPPDPVADGPLHYVPSGDSDYLLYSIGWNGKDDGGVIARQPGSTRPDLDNGDWVWASRPALYRFVASPSKAGS